MREIVAMLVWLTPLYFVFHDRLPNEIKLLLFNIFFFDLQAQTRVGAMHSSNEGFRGSKYGV